MFGIIYLITNSINGKQYVGQTKYPLITRWKSHVWWAKNNLQCALHCAIRKYGSTQFKIEQIDYAKSCQELDEKEIYWIMQLRTFTPRGYNLTTGGKRFNFSEESKCKISASQFNRIVSNETKQKQSISHKKLMSFKENRQKYSEVSFYRKKTSCPNSHPYDNVNTYIDKRKHRFCRTCNYLRHGKKLPCYLQRYVTGKEVYKKIIKNN
jgi:group I intron endonuclease